jgi:hypothetical protein
MARRIRLLNVALMSLTMSLTIVASVALPARAQSVEVGTSLASATFGLEDSDPTIVGVPGDGFGLFRRGIYVAFFPASKIAIEPSAALQLIDDDTTDYIANLGIQLSYLFKGNDVSSPFIFGDAGLIKISDVDSIKSVGAGLGYRWLANPHVALRLDGRWTHFTDGGGNSATVTFSIGGLFGG